jgi:hypothetical protein
LDVSFGLPVAELLPLVTVQLAAQNKTNGFERARKMLAEDDPV